MEKYWLKPSICFEPLVCSWYASAHLVSPTTAGLILNKRFLKILRSFITYPELHQQASAEKQLSGGAFVNLSNHTVVDVKNLYSQILENRQDLIQLSEAIDGLNLLLEQTATGNSLEQIYFKIPKFLAGCVELVYDMNHNPSIRFIESFIYHKYYDKSSQTILLSPLESDKRSFILSTPRFPNPKDVHLQVSFDDSVIDLLCRSRRHGVSLNELRQNLNLSAKCNENFEALFNNIPPSSFNQKYNGEDIKVRYFGHACVLIETKNISLLIDPLIAYDKGDERFTFLDLPNFIDYVLITHSHQDHFFFFFLLQIRHQVRYIVVPDNNSGFIADPGLEYILKHIGFQSIITLKEMEKITTNEIEITGVPFLGEHGDLNIQTKLAYHIKIYDKSFLFAVDSNNLDINLYHMLMAMIGPVNMLFIGMECVGAPFSWAYGALFHKPIKREDDQSRRLSGSNAEKVWQIITAIQCTKVVVYAMGQEPWLHHIMGLEYSKDSTQLIEAKNLLKKCSEFSMDAEMPFGKREWIVKKTNKD